MTPDRPPLTEAELDAISERLLDKMLKRLAHMATAENDAPPPAFTPEPKPTKKPTIRCDAKVQPTAEDYERAARWHRRRTRTGE